MISFADRLSAMTPYVPGEQPKVAGLIKLNTNENPFPPAPGVKEAVENAARSLEKYSDPTSAKLIAALAQNYGLLPENVLVSNGSDEMLAFAMLAFCDENHPAAFPSVTYGFYGVLTELFGVPAHKSPLHADFSVDEEGLKKKGETVFLANPNAPTGILLAKEKVEEILKADPDRVVIVDEAYADFAGESMLSLLPLYDNLLIIRTFSKSRSLAGGRLGFALGNQLLIDALRCVKDSFHPYNVSALTQAAGIAVLAAEEYTKDCVAKICATRDKTAKALAEAGFLLTDSKTNFLFAEKPGVSGKYLAERLRQEKILVRRFDADGISDRLRISVGREEEMELLTKKLIAFAQEAEAGEKNL